MEKKNITTQTWMVILDQWESVNDRGKCAIVRLLLYHGTSFDTMEGYFKIDEYKLLYYLNNNREQFAIFDGNSRIKFLD